MVYKKILMHPLLFKITSPQRAISHPKLKINVIWNNLFARREELYITITSFSLKIIASVREFVYNLILIIDLFDITFKNNKNSDYFISSMALCNVCV